MNMRQLECFRAVMVTGTASRAAQVLGISQPAVSKLIAGLEHEIGFGLFKRRLGRLVPTPEASYFINEVNRALETLDQTADLARQIRNLELGRLVIASYPGIAIHFLPTVVAEFMSGRSNVNVRLLSRSSHVVRELIPAQQFDVGIVELPVDHPGVEIEPMIFECRGVLPSGHPLTEKEVITAADLDGAPFVSLFRGHMTHYRLERAFADAGSRWNVVAETQYFATCCSFVINGVGASVVDPFTAAHYEGRGLVVRQFEPVIPYDLAIVYPTDRVRSRLTEAFVSKLKERLTPFLADRRAHDSSLHAP